MSIGAQASGCIPLDGPEAHERWWTAYLAGPPEPLALPLDRTRPALRTLRRARPVPLAPETAGALSRFARAHGVDPTVVGLAALGVLLERYTGQADLLVGLDRVPVRVRINPCQPFGALVALLGAAARAACARHDASLERALRRARVAQPPFTVAVLRDTAGMGPELDLALIVSGLETSRPAVALGYDPDLFAPATIARAAAHLGRIVAQATRDPDRSLASIEPLSQAELRRMLHEWNDTARDLALPPTLAAAIEGAAARFPDVTAVADAAGGLTYRELNGRAAALARALRAAGLTERRPLAVATGRGAWLVVGALAAWKLGVPFLPLDPGLPFERLRFTIEDSDAAALVHDSSGTALPAGELAALVVDVATEWDLIALAPAETDAPPEPAADGTAYIVYTSGTTGTPKGVACGHRGALNQIYDMQRRYPVRAGQRCASGASVGFDMCLYELLTALCFGATLAFVPDDARADAAAYVRWLQEEAIEVAFSTAFPLSELAARAHSGFALSRLVVGAEPIDEPVLALIAAKIGHVRVVNAYGPSECTFFSHVYELAPPYGGGRAPIGRPLANTRGYLLDESGRPVPVGVLGELYLAGAQVAHGYLNRPQTSAERFVPEPFAASPGARAYRTGDMCRWLPDGNLLFVRRNDRQTKIRGFRAEPGEVEAVLRIQPGVRDALVVARGEGASAALHAYLVLSDPATTAGLNAIRQALRTTLPPYLVPATLTVLDSLPLTANGKLDHAALPAPAERTGPGASDEPRTPLQRAMAAVWCEVLGLERVGTHENFFDLGGQSLTAAQTVVLLRERLALDLPLRRFIEAPTIAELTASDAR